VSAGPVQQLAKWHQGGVKPQLSAGLTPENEKYCIHLDYLLCWIIVKVWTALNGPRKKYSVNAVLRLPVPLKKEISYLTEQPTTFKDIVASITNN
jgi:hypothetical protein